MPGDGIFFLYELKRIYTYRQLLKPFRDDAMQVLASQNCFNYLPTPVGLSNGFILFHFIHHP